MAGFWQKRGSLLPLLNAIVRLSRYHRNEGTPGWSVHVLPDLYVDAVQVLESPTAPSACSASGKHVPNEEPDCDPMSDRRLAYKGVAP